MCLCIGNLQGGIDQIVLSHFLKKCMILNAVLRDFLDYERLNYFVLMNDE